VNLYLKKLKIILLFSYILISIYTCFSLFKPVKYINEKISFSGTILDISEKDNYTSLIVQSKTNKYLVYTNKNNCKLGQKVYIKGIKKTPNKNTNFYLFNYQNYLKSLRINYIINTEEIKIIKGPNILFQIKNYFFKYVNNFKNKEYFITFLYGKNELEDDIYENYKTIGIIHLFALSGMHIHFLVSILDKIFKKNKKVITMFLVLYLLFVNPSPSIYRATLSEIIYRVLKINKKDIIIFLFFINLLYNPFCIYHIGFNLSYIISFTLINNKRQEKNYFKNLIYTSYLCFLVSMPILINQSFEINFFTVIYNLIFIPFVTFLLFPSIIISFIIPPLEIFLNIEINFIEYFSILCSNINIFKISFSYLNIIEFLILYLIIFISIYKTKYIILLFIFLLLNYFSHYFIKTNKVIFLDVNQGDSTLIEYKNSLVAILIDTGGIIDKDLTKNTLTPSLRARGIKYLDFLILTHGDYDHMGEAINLVNNFKVEKVILNCGEFNEFEQELINVLVKKKIQYYSCIKELNIDDNKLYFLNNKDYGNENDNSSVIYTELNNYKFLFMGDAGVEVEEVLIEKYNLNDIDTLKVGHHGSKTSSSKSFLDDVNPKYSIISVGKNNRYGHPNANVLANLEDSKIYRTDEDGSIMFKIKNNKLKIETCTP